MALRGWKWATPLLVGLLALWPAVALAIDPPDDTPTIERIRAFTNVLEGNDLLVIATYRLTYETIPDEPVGFAYVGRFLRDTTSEELNATNPMAFNSRGYGLGIFSLYWTNAERTAASIEFGDPNTEIYVAEIRGKPGIFPGGAPSGSSNTIDWGDPTRTVEELRQAILDIAEELEQDPSWAINEIFLLTFSTGTVRLSTAGENYFGRAIPNIAAMGTGLFSSNLVGAVFDERDFDKTYSEGLMDQLDNTPIGDGRESLAELLQVSANFAGAILALGLTGLGIFGVAGLLGRLQVDRGIEFALLAGVVMLVLFTAMGLLNMEVLAIMAFLCLAGLAFTLFLRRQG